MKEMHRASYGEQGAAGGTFHALSQIPLSSNLHLFTNPEALQTPSFWVLMEASYIGLWRLNSLSSPSPFGGVQGVGLKVSTF